MSKPETTAEDEYFAREEALKQYKLAKELAAKRAQDEASALKTQHWMKCPKCGNDLATLSFRGVEVDRCYHCHGTWLDAGELEKLTGPGDQHKILDSIINIFKVHK